MIDGMHVVEVLSSLGLHLCPLLVCLVSLDLWEANNNQEY